MNLSVLPSSRHQLAWYNGSNALWMGAFSLQQLLVTWILVGILHESPERVGLAQLFIGIPGLIFMLWGGVIGDQMDGRFLLIRTHFLSAIPPLALAMVNSFGLLNYSTLIVTALAASLLNAASSPARAGLLNSIAGPNLQHAISLSTAIASIAAIVGTKLGGELESIGLNQILYIQALVFVIGGFITTRLPKRQVSRSTDSGSTIETIIDGFRYVWRFKLCRDLIGLNFVSSLFNAGGWLVVFPFIVNRVYHGDAVFLANMLAIFTFGALVSNFVMLKFMPFRFPGRLYLIMQLTRILILALIWIEPSASLLALAALSWGINMGVTTTTSRLIIQEVAAKAYRSRIMSIYTLTQISAAPLGSVVLGIVISIWGPLNALLPGVIASMVIFGSGFLFTSIWSYESPAISNR